MTSGSRPRRARRARARRRAGGAHAASRSSFDPGKTRTAIRARNDLDLVALDQWVGEQLLAHPLELPVRLVAPLDVELDHPADARLLDREPEVIERGSTASPWGSRMPSFGRTITVAFIRAPHPDRRGRRRTGPREALERLDVAGARPVDDLGGQLRPGRLLVPACGLAEVAHELLVVGQLRATRRVLVGRPEAGRVRCQRLVAERQRPSASSPSSNFVSAIRIPRAAAYSAAKRYRASETRSASSKSSRSTRPAA